MLGPTGIGLAGLYQNIMATATTLFGCGLDSSGVRQIATAHDDQQLFVLIRRALVWANILLGVTGMLVLWVVSGLLSQWVFHDNTHASEMGWLGIGMFLSLMVSSKVALLQGLRRIDAIAKVKIFGAILGAVTGVVLIWLLGERGLLWFVIVAPAVNLVFSHWYVASLPKNNEGLDWLVLRRQWQAMFSLGIPIMAAGLLTLVTQWWREAG